MTLCKFAAFLATINGKASALPLLEKALCIADALFIWVWILCLGRTV